MFSTARDPAVLTQVLECYPSMNLVFSFSITINGAATLNSASDLLETQHA